MREFQDIRLAFGESDEYSFVFPRECQLYGGWLGMVEGSGPAGAAGPMLWLSEGGARTQHVPFIAATQHTCRGPVAASPCWNLGPTQTSLHPLCRPTLLQTGVISGLLLHCQLRPPVAPAPARQAPGGHTAV